jgi:predicted nucleic-acid-binding protein
MRAIDTNVLVRLLARDDPAQTRAAEKFIASGAWVSHLVLAETCWVLESVYQVSASGLIQALDMLQAHESLVLQDAETVRRATDRLRGKPSLGFSDCLVLEIALAAGHKPLGTFDRALAKSGGPAAHRIP